MLDTENYLVLDKKNTKSVNNPCMDFLSIIEGL